MSRPEPAPTGAASRATGGGGHAGGALLRIEGLVKTWPGGETALRGIDLEIKAGVTTVVVGPSGAGKSTLVHCVNRLVEPTAGRIRLGEIDIIGLRGRDLRRMRRRIGMIFQDFGLVDRLTVMENVLSGRLGHVGTWRAWRRRFPEADVQLAFDLLERVDLLDHVNKRADALSGGQRQRVGIARALMHAEDLLLVDEPTASLDPATARRIMRLLVGLARERGLTALVNMHDIPLARLFADRIVGLRAGRIVHDGPPSSLDDPTLTRIYGDEDWTATTTRESVDA